MRNSTAYFSGVATVFTATALGFGSALILTSSTAPRPPVEPTKLERSIAATAQASHSPEEPKPATPSDSGTSQGIGQTSQATAPQPLQSAPGTQQPQTTLPTSTTSATADTNQPTATSEAQSPANAYARGSDADIRKYVHKRDRRWARRHYRDEDAVPAAASDPADPSARPTSAADSSAQSEQADSAQPQVKPADQKSPKIDEANTAKSKQKHERRWARGYASYDDARGDDRRQTVDVREAPRDEAPQFLAPPRWRPLFNGDEDD